MTSNQYKYGLYLFLIDTIFSTNNMSEFKLVRRIDQETDRSLPFAHCVTKVNLHGIVGTMNKLLSKPQSEPLTTP